MKKLKRFLCCLDVDKGKDFTILLYSKFDSLTLEAIVILVKLFDNPINIKYSFKRRVLSRASMNYYGKHKISNITIKEFYQEIRKAKTWVAGNIIGQ